MKNAEGHRDRGAKGRSGWPVTRVSNPCEAVLACIASPLVLLLLFPHLANAQSTRAADQVDQATQDVLKELGAPAASQPAAAPGISAVGSSAGSTDEETGV